MFKSIKYYCFALFFQNILRQRPEEKLENAKNILKLRIATDFFHKAVVIAILEYLFQKSLFLMHSRVANPNIFS